MLANMQVAKFSVMHGHCAKGTYNRLMITGCGGKFSFPTEKIGQTLSNEDQELIQEGKRQTRRVKSEMNRVKSPRKIVLEH